MKTKVCECGKLLGGNAKICPECGRRFTTWTTKFVLIAMLPFILIILFLIYFNATYALQHGH